MITPKLLEVFISQRASLLSDISICARYEAVFRSQKVAPRQIGSPSLPENIIGVPLKRTFVLTCEVNHFTPLYS